MKYIHMICTIFALLLLLSYPVMGTTLHHDMKIVLHPEKHSMSVTDKIEIPKEYSKDSYHLFLHQSLHVEECINCQLAKSDQTTPRKEDFLGVEDELQLSDEVPLAEYILTPHATDTGSNVFTIQYSGLINHQIEQKAEEYARSFSETPGIISEQGVYLSGSSFWVPWFGNILITFTLEIKVPLGWDAVSQGTRTSRIEEKEYCRISWNADNPMEEIYIVSGPFVYYEETSGPVTVMAYLQSDDEHLADKYLMTTRQYLDMYQKLIGPFPFTKFALVENFWETGYGMPSFTLLGPQVIRFPFILHSSYPHELLHNWWGNSVYVDWSSGNWCEGLTVYLADHLIKEQRGQGEEYRQTTLQKYTHYVNPSNDFPLQEFRSRNSASSEAIGYGKSMMLWHMLRQKFGDEIFIKAIQQFYHDYRWKIASFSDLKKSFEMTSGNDLGLFFEQWTGRTGAPQLAVSNVKTKRDGDVFQLFFDLTQIQQEDFFKIDVPIACHCSDNPDASLLKVEMNNRQQSFQVDLTCRPVLLEVDPRFDLFRRLHRNEIPPALSQAFGAQDISIVLPESNDPHYKAYKQLAEQWSKDKTDVMTLFESEKQANNPQTSVVWLFGMNNSMKSLFVRGLGLYPVKLAADSITLDSNTIPIADHSCVMVSRNPEQPDQILVWLITDNDQAVNGLSRKLPHYGKYSYLMFEGNEPTNIVKGRWPVVDSPLSAEVIQADDVTVISRQVNIPKEKPLAMLPPVFSKKSMLDHVRFLSSQELEGRGYGSIGLDKAADYIAEFFQKIGLQPGGDNQTYFQSWTDEEGPEKKPVIMKNVIGILKGQKETFENQAAIICAHYDHLGHGWPDVHDGNEGLIHPGADDNASGIAVLLELADHFKSAPTPDRTLIFIAFTGEECSRKGSKHFIENYPSHLLDKIMGVINLDSVGRLGEKQLLILGASSAEEWKHIVMGCSYVTGVPAKVVTQDLDSSDQVSFIERGIPGIQIFSGPHEDYHRPTDTFDKIDPTGLVKVADFTREAIVYLSQRETPMTTGEAHQRTRQNHSNHKSGKRQVKTGTMPDFTFSGKGYRIGDVAPDSPAARAGIHKGDIIIRLDDTSITNLKDYSDTLKQYKPGDTLTITLKREDREITVTLKLAAR